MFFSAVGHDVRTPLNAIVGFAQLLKLGIDDPEEREKALDALLSSANALLKLVGDVVDLSRLEAGVVTLFPEPTDVGRLVAEVAGAFASALRLKNLELVTRLGEMPMLELDAPRVRQILFNLLGNAVKFTDVGKVGVSADYEDGTLTLTVQDTGRGISPEDQRRIADPYARVGDGRRGGAGLGLAVAKRLVFRMGGEMSLKSAVGQGTVFTVALPGVEVSSARRQKAFSMTQRIKVAVASRSARAAKQVMVVDDSQVNLLVLKSLLLKLGYAHVTLAGSGREALEKLRENPRFDIVLTDVWMPEMDGCTLARAIAADPALRHVKTYAVTGDTEIRADGSGFLDVFMKPVTLEVLGKVL